MVEMTNELLNCLKAFQKEFSDIVPLRELPASTTTNQLIEAIKSSIKRKENILPEIFGFGSLENNSDVLI